MKREIELLRLQEQHKNQYIENANLQYDTIKKIHHDLKGQMLAIHKLISDNNIEAAEELLSKNTKTIEAIETFGTTNNVIVNAIINSKLTSASAMGIHVSFLSVYEFNGIDDLDLCNLLSNMLDNSITAVLEIQERIEKNIAVSISLEDDVYTFIVKNTISESVLSKNSLLKTTKKDKENHGYGIQIIKDIAEKYDGRCDFYEAENMFCCQVIMLANMEGSV